MEVEHLKRFNPYFLLLSFLCALGFLYTIANTQSYYADSLAAARSTYASTIALTKVQLSGLMQEAVIDSTLKDNLQWGLNHSVEKTLESNLRVNELDYLAVYTDDCQLVAKASLQKLLPTCDPKALKKAGGLLWRRANDKGLLTASMPINADGATRWHLTGGVVVDTTWLGKQQPTLVSQVKALDLDLGFLASAPRAGLIYNEDAFLPDTFGLFTRSFLVKLFSAVNDAARTRTRLLINILILSCLGLAFLLWRQQRAAVQSQNENVTNFLNWIRTFSGNSGPSDGAAPSFVASPAIPEAQTMLIAKDAQATAHIASLQDKIQQLTTDLRQKDAQIRQAEHRFLGFAKLESLSLQLNRCVKTLKNDLSKIQNLGEDVIDTLVHGVSRNLHALSAVTRAWQNEIQLRGIRRFARVMTETQGESGATLLEEQIRALMQINEQMEDQLVHVTSFAQKMAQVCKETGKLGTHWFDLTHDADLSAEPGNLLEVTLSAQDLMTDAQKERVRFSNQFELGGVKPAELALGKPIWVSVLYHVYAALCEEVFNHQTGELTSSFRDLPDSRRLIIATHMAQGDHDAKLQKSHHLLIAQKLAKRYGFAVDLVPSVTGLTGVCLSWSKKKADERSVPNAKPATAPSSSVSL